MYERVLQYCCCCEGGDCCEGGGLDPRTAIEGSFSAWRGLGKPNRGRDRGKTDSGSDRDSDETFQISRNLGLKHVEFVCLLDSQLCSCICSQCLVCTTIYLPLYQLCLRHFLRTVFSKFQASILFYERTSLRHLCALCASLW